MTQNIHTVLNKHYAFLLTTNDLFFSRSQLYITYHCLGTFQLRLLAGRTIPSCQSPNIIVKLRSNTQSWELRTLILDITTERTLLDWRLIFQMHIVIACYRYGYLSYRFQISVIEILLCKVMIFFDTKLPHVLKDYED